MVETETIECTLVRRCYGCGREMTAEEVAAGQKMLDEVMALSDGQFEGWVHCQGPPEMFVQENDGELERLWPGFCPGAAHACIACVKKMV